MHIIRDGVNVALDRAKGWSDEKVGTPRAVEQLVGRRRREVDCSEARRESSRLLSRQVHELTTDAQRGAYEWLLSCVRLMLGERTLGPMPLSLFVNQDSDLHVCI